MKRNLNTPDPSAQGDFLERADKAAEAAVVRALEHQPCPAIPPDFAARVAQLATAQATPQPKRLTGWGPRLTLASGALLTAAMFALAPHTTAALTDLRFDTELLLFAELGGLVLFSHRLFSRD